MLKMKIFSTATMNDKRSNNEKAKKFLIFLVRGFSHLDRVALSGFEVNFALTRMFFKSRS